MQVYSQIIFTIENFVLSRNGFLIMSMSGCRMGCAHIDDNDVVGLPTLSPSRLLL